MALATTCSLRACDPCELDGTRGVSCSAFIPLIVGIDDGQQRDSWLEFVGTHPFGVR
jgi:hypothetical protein